MNTLPVQPASTPPLRPLLMLTTLVLLAHVWVLQAAPMQWAMEAEPASRLRPLITRTIEIKPASTAAVAPSPPPARRAARATSPVSQQNGAPALVAPAQAAIESIAPPLPPPAESSPPVAAPVPAAPVAAASALTIPGSVRLKYAMTGRSKNMDYHASAQLDWRQDGQSYEANMAVSAFGLGSRSMASSGRITGDGLAPTRFLDKSRSERAAHFDADKGKISFSANTPDAPWRPDAQDRVSVFVQLASLLAGNPAAYPPGSSVSLYTAGPTAVDTWTFVVDAQETLNLPIGETSAVKLTRKPQRDYDQAVDVWLAPALAWLPVRIRITQQNGDFVDQQLRVAE